jgi:hypothetical protein
MTKTPLGVAVQEDQQLQHPCHDREPDAERSSRNESLSDINEAPKPENLAGYEDEEQGEEDQPETAELVGVCDQECSTNKDCEYYDRAPMNQDTPANQEQTGGHV